MFWKQASFKKIQAEWYEKLTKLGFEDAEKNEYDLKDRSEDVYRTGSAKKPSKLEIETKQEYFLLLSQFIQERAPEFDDSIDYFVMTKFAKGLRTKQICDLLSHLGCKRDRKTVRFIRRKYENRWGIRAWKPEQMKRSKPKSL